MGNNQINSKYFQPFAWEHSGQILYHLPGKPIVSNVKSSHIHSNNKYLGLQYIVELKDSNSEQLEKHYLEFYEMRKTKLHPNIMGIYSVAKGKSLYKFDDTQFQADKCIFKVITHYLQIRLSDINSFNFQQAIVLLKGITMGVLLLFKQIGGFILTGDMVGIDSTGAVKVWFNSNFAENFPEFKTIEEIGQKQMCFQIYKLLAKQISKIKSFPSELLTSIMQMDKLQKMLLLLRKVSDSQMNLDLMLKLILKQKALKTPNQNNDRMMRQPHKQQSFFVPNTYNNYNKYQNSPKNYSNPIENGRFRFSKSKTIAGMNSMQPKGRLQKNIQQEARADQVNQIHYADKNKLQFMNVEKKKNLTIDNQYPPFKKTFTHNQKNLSGHQPHVSQTYKKKKQIPLMFKQTKTHRQKRQDNIFFAPQQFLKNKVIQNLKPSFNFNKKQCDTQTFHKQNFGKERISSPQLKSKNIVQHSQGERYTVDSSFKLANIQKQKINLEKNLRVELEENLCGGETVKNTSCQQTNSKKFLSSINNKGDLCKREEKQKKRKVQFNETQYPTLVSIQSHQSIVIATGKSLKITNNQLDNRLNQLNNLTKISNFLFTPNSTEKKKPKSTCVVRFTDESSHQNQKKRKQQSQLGQLHQMEKIRRKNSIENLLSVGSLTQMNRNQYGTQFDEYEERTLTQIEKEYMKRFINEQHSDHQLSLAKIISKFKINEDKINQLQKSNLIKKSQIQQQNKEKFQNTKQNDINNSLFSQQIMISNGSSTSEKSANQVYQQKMCFLKDKNNKNETLKKIDFQKTYEQNDQDNIQKNIIINQQMESYAPLSDAAKDIDHDDRQIDPVKWQACEINLDDLILNLSSSKCRLASYLHTIKQTQRDRSSQFDEISEGLSIVTNRNLIGSLSGVQKYTYRSVTQQK